MKWLSVTASSMAQYIQALGYSRNKHVSPTILIIEQQVFKSTDELFISRAYRLAPFSSIFFT